MTTLRTLMTSLLSAGLLAVGLPQGAVAQTWKKLPLRANADQNTWKGLCTPRLGVGRHLGARLVRADGTPVGKLNNHWFSSELTGTSTDVYYYFFESVRSPGDTRISGGWGIEGSGDGLPSSDNLNAKWGKLKPCETYSEFEFFNSGSKSFDDSTACGITSAGGLRCAAGFSGGNYSLFGATYKEFVLATMDGQPIDVPGLSSGVSGVATGPFNQCVWTTGGDVKCWGINDYGQLGNGTTSDVPLYPPSMVTVSGIGEKVTLVKSGIRDFCAVTVTGRVSCWGGTFGSSPKRVPGMNNIVSVVVGDQHICGLTTSGGVLCAGRNYSGQLGNGTYTDSSNAVAVAGLSSGVAQLTTAADQTCAIMTTGQVRCWGADWHGYLGGDKNTPFELAGVSNVRQFYWTWEKTFALTNTGVLWQITPDKKALIDFGPNVRKTGTAFFNPYPMANGHCAWMSTGSVKCTWLDDNEPNIILDKGLPTEAKTKDVSLLKQYYVFGS